MEGDQCDVVGVGVAEEDLGFHADRHSRILYQENLTVVGEDAERFE